MAEVPWYLVLDDIGRRAEALKRKKTKADRIRAMADEELANFLYVKTCEDGYPAFDTVGQWLDWLRQPAE